MRRAQFRVSKSTGLEAVSGYLVEVPELGITIALDKHEPMVGYPQWRASEFRTGAWLAEGRTRDAAVAAVMDKANRLGGKEYLAKLTRAFLEKHEAANGGEL